MKLLIVQLPPFSCYFIPLWSKYSTQIPVLKHPQSMLFLCERPSFTLIKYKWLNYDLYVLTFTFPDSKREDKTLWTELIREHLTKKLQSSLF
jgi:hypothetical protein